MSLFWPSRSPKCWSLTLMFPEGRVGGKHFGCPLWCSWAIYTTSAFGPGKVCHSFTHQEIFMNSELHARHCTRQQPATTRETSKPLRPSIAYPLFSKWNGKWSFLKAYLPLLPPHCQANLSCSKYASWVPPPLPPLPCRIHPTLKIWAAGRRWPPPRAGSNHP